MWRDVLQFALDFLKNIGELVGYLFKPINEIIDEVVIDVTLPGLDSSAINSFWFNLMKNWNFRLIDILSIGGLAIFFLIYLFKKIDIFS